MDYFFSIWTIAVAITISVVAAYYSIVGLTAIFAGSVLSVAIMGAVLEIGKITAAVWLHRFWNESEILIKLYLVPAVMLLMVVTSMGIFGFLSKAHVEQGASGLNLNAQLERIDTEIQRQQILIDRANATINGFSTQVASADADIQSRIDVQQATIDGIRDRLKADIEVQNSVIDNENREITLLQQQLSRIIEQQNDFAELEKANDITTLQIQVGAEPDGVKGPDTLSKIAQVKLQFKNQQQELEQAIKELQSQPNPVIIQAQSRIQQLQQTADNEIKLATDAIASFRNQLVSITTQDRSDDVASQNKIITAANLEIDRLFSERFNIQAELRAIEVEVGPIKYIAELIYGDADRELLERAVRWMIIVLVAVFDPLAVVLILAGLSIAHMPKTYQTSPEKPLTEAVQHPKQIYDDDELDGPDVDATTQSKQADAPITELDRNEISKGFNGNTINSDDNRHVADPPARPSRIIRTTQKDS